MDTIKKRLSLKPRAKLYIAGKLGFRRKLDPKPGSWSIVDPATGKQRRFGVDAGDSDGDGVRTFNYSQALRYVHAHASDKHDVCQITPIEAVKERAAKIRTAYNVLRFIEPTSKIRLPDWGNQPLAALTRTQWEDFAYSLGMAPGTLRRTLKPLKAAFNDAAEKHAIAHRPWKRGLDSATGADGHRDFRLMGTVEQDSDKINEIIDTADKRYPKDPDFGLFLEVLSFSGMRPQQVEEIPVSGLRGDKLVIPSSRKGKANKPRKSIVVCINPDLAARLRAIAKGRALHESLLVRRKSTYQNRFRKISAELDVDWTLYAFRYAAIRRLIKQRETIADIAGQLDTGIKEIERHYYAENARIDRPLFERRKAA